ncbi:nicotianamine synthase family protein [Myceligenerans pegani]|uniref:nicotianamine synthase family protein n=1 Tax=Myceligenerans pegani TaxID=2776917 RepID=UPI001CF06321|nr:nicotianamine synthase family protein [Myceligenerans sp. TRM 65318]
MRTWDDSRDLVDLPSSDAADADTADAPTAQTADAVAERLARLTDELAALASLTPSPDVNRLFSAVVRTVVTTPVTIAREVGARPGVTARADELRDLSARGEAQLEAHWSRRVADAADPVAELGRFPYRDNYRDLVAMELRLLRRHLDRRAPRSVVVLGCGPLPLTATGYARGLGARTVAVDRDPAAVAAARGFLAATRDPGTVVVHDDAVRVPLHEYDVVVLAALVGTTTTAKAALLRSLAERMRPGALLLARSAHGLRALLYPEIDTATMAGFDVLDVKHPAGDVINSMIVARRV